MSLEHDFLMYLNGQGKAEADEFVIVRNPSPGAGLVPVHPEDEASIKALYMAGLSLTDIAHKMYFKIETMGAIIDRMVLLGRIPPRSRHQRYKQRRDVYKAVSVPVEVRAGV